MASGIDPDSPQHSLDQEQQGHPEQDLGSVDIIDGKLETVLQSVGVDTRDPNVQRTLQVMSVTMARGSLPLPPPALLAEYKEVLPDLPEKITRWTETQATHRRELEIRRLEGSERRMDRGQLGALAVSLVGMSIAGAVGILGSEVVAGIIAIVAIGGPTAAILLANKTQVPNMVETAQNRNKRIRKKL